MGLPIIDVAFAVKGRHLLQFFFRDILGFHARGAFDGRTLCFGGASADSIQGRFWIVSRPLFKKPLRRTMPKLNMESVATALTRLSVWVAFKV